MPIVALITHHSAHVIDRVAEKFPAQKIALCHLGIETADKDEKAFRDFVNILPLARRPNIMAKASALPAYTSEAYPFRALPPYIRKVYDAFGPQRMVWGTDLGRLHCTYKQAIALVTKNSPGYPPRTRNGSWPARCANGWGGTFERRARPGGQQ